MILISTAASTTLIAICRLSGIPTATMLTGITSIAFAIGNILVYIYTYICIHVYKYVNMHVHIYVYTSYNYICCMQLQL